VERALRVRYVVNEQTVSAVASASPVLKLGDQATVLTEVLSTLVGSSFDKLSDLEAALAPMWAKVGNAAAPVRKAVIAAAMTRDPGAEPVKSKEGFEADPDLRDTENIPLDEDVEVFIEREVRPYAPDAWADESKTKIGYEIPFTRHFYKYLPPRPLADIDADIKASEQRILSLLAKVTE
jgi:type I restriction enzyme M protein